MPKEAAAADTLLADAETTTAHSVSVLQFDLLNTGGAQEIAPVELHYLIKNGPAPCLLDVREPEEHKLVKLRGSVLIPLMSIADRFDEIRELSEDGSTTIIVYCRSGKRSAMAIEWLSRQGISNLKNLRGGINAYGKEADKRIKPY